MIPSTATFTLSLYRSYFVFLGQVRYVWLLLAVLATLMSMPGLGLRLSTGTIPLVSSPHAILAVPQQPPASPASNTKPVTPPSTPAVPNVSVVPPQECVTPTYSSPLPLKLSDQANGLTQTIDATVYYKIYGNTTKQIKAQLLQCAPSTRSAAESGSFAAETGGSLSWQYDTVADNAGACTISNVKVGLHINMILPTWQPTSSTTGGIADSWQNLMSGLTVHENGHVALYQQYANQLLGDVQSLSAASCSAIADSVAATAAADVASLNAANASYDATTNHGVKQGAVLR